MAIERISESDLEKLIANQESLSVEFSWFATSKTGKIPTYFPVSL